MFPKKLICLVATSLLFAATGCSELRNLRGTSDSVGSLDQRCPSQFLYEKPSKECREWKRQKDEEVANEEARRRAEYERRLEQQEQERKAAMERERIAAQEDERHGYRNISFEDFALDARSMIGAKIVLHGIYVAKGDRMARDSVAALRWIGGMEEKGVIVPLLTDRASRSARAAFLHCADIPQGCPMIVRGRIEVLTLRNSFGVERREPGLVVDSTR